MCFSGRCEMEGYMGGCSLTDKEMSLLKEKFGGSYLCNLLTDDDERSERDKQLKKDYLAYLYEIRYADK